MRTCRNKCLFLLYYGIWSMTPFTQVPAGGSSDITGKPYFPGNDCGIPSGRDDSKQVDRPGPHMEEKANIPFRQALVQAAIKVPRLDDILDYALLLGNGDINGLIYQQGNHLCLKMGKNDVWDARLITENDPPLPTLRRVKELAWGPWKNRQWILPEGVSLPSSEKLSVAHPYPCPRTCATIRLELSVREPGTPAESTVPQHSVPQMQGSLDLRRAAAQVNDVKTSSASTTIRALADRNVFWIESSLPIELMPQEASYELPKPVLKKTEEVTSITQELPGDADWPGMSFAVVLAGRNNRYAVAIVTSLESSRYQDDALNLARSAICSETESLIETHERAWENFWSASGIAIDDEVLQNSWYRNLYFLRCFSKTGVQSCGLFAGLIDDVPAWHGDYHTNYNIQQTYWTCYITNHPELAEPYDRLIISYLPRAQWIARQVFNMQGAYFPHVLFAYEPPYPEQCRSRNGRQFMDHVWGMTLGVSGLTAQPLWRHYQYQPNLGYLEHTAYPVVSEVARFYIEFIRQCDRDAGGKVILAPSVSPEHWGWGKYFEYNQNCAFDIAMIRFTLQAAIEASQILGREDDLVPECRAALDLLPDYPTTKTQPFFVVDVLNAPRREYNIAVPAAPVFPGETVTFWSSAQEKQLFQRTIDTLLWNGNNSTIILSAARARLSMPDTWNWLRNEIVHRLRPNGILMLNRRGGRFNHRGHYTEQFAASMAVSELLLQSVGDIIRVFPAWPGTKAASFHQLRGQGGFLISAGQKDEQVEYIHVVSTVGGPLRLDCPWPTACLRHERSLKTESLCPGKNNILKIQTRPNERLSILPDTQN